MSSIVVITCNLQVLTGNSIMHFDQLATASSSTSLKIHNVCLFHTLCYSDTARITECPFKDTPTYISYIFFKISSTSSSLSAIPLHIGIPFIVQQHKLETIGLLHKEASEHNGCLQTFLALWKAFGHLLWFLRWIIPPMVVHPEKIDFRRFV